MDRKITDQDSIRHKIIQLCNKGELTNKVAAAQLGITVRQLQRLKFKATEDIGSIIHRSRGRTSNRATSESIVTLDTTFLKEKNHTDFGPTFAQEKLAQKGVELSVETIRAIMIKNDLWQVHERRTSDTHHEWRERRLLYG